MWPGKTCKFCHTPLQCGICSKCGEWSEKLNKTNNRCTKCSTKEFKSWIDNKNAEDEQKLQDWLDKIKSIPLPYTTLTEEQWLKACRHFGGCAYCGKSQIDSRSMFIPFNMGGRYCAWNVIPSCERCENMRKDTSNPFSRMNEQVGRSKANVAIKYGLSRENLQVIVDYLGGYL